MPRRLPLHCVEDTDRHGNLRIYYRRRKGYPKIRLHGIPWTPEFMQAYDSAVGKSAPISTWQPTPNTWRWLCVKYFTESAEYKRMEERSRRVRRNVIEATFDEKIRPDSDKRFADMPILKMD